MEKYDVIVIGAGSAGLANSGVANVIGLKTLLIEQNGEYFGGDCTNFGCVPSKALIHISSLFHAAKKAQQFGLNATGVADMEKVLAYIHGKQETIRNEEDAESLRKKGIDVIIGFASFESEKVIKVNETSYEGRLILLCTGSSPRHIEIPGMDTVPVYTNEDIFFDCKKLPKDFIVIGGGPIGCELGQAFSRLGSKVSIINRGDRLLQNETEKISKILEQKFLKEDIDVYINTEVIKFENGKAFLKAEYGKHSEINCDAVLLAVGRDISTDGFKLEKAGIKLTEKGKIKVNDYLQTTNASVYAVGDSTGSYMFSHGAEKMTRQLWRNLLIPILKKKNTLHDLSWVTFTEPQVAHFGLTQKQMDERGINYYHQDQSLEEDDRAIIQEYTYGHESLWLTKSKKKLLAGSLISPNAGEILQEMELAKHANVSVSTLTKRVYPYPVQTRINQKTLRGLSFTSYSELTKKAARFIFRLFH